MIVVKIGGSLGKADALRSWLAVLARGKGRVVVVPGGGAFADGVREEQRRLRVVALIGAVHAGVPWSGSSGVTPSGSFHDGAEGLLHVLGHGPLGFFDFVQPRMLDPDRGHVGHHR